MFWVSIKRGKIWQSIGCTRSLAIAEVWAGRAGATPVRIEFVG